jgi:hypothetical protein
LKVQAAIPILAALALAPLACADQDPLLGALWTQMPGRAITLIIFDYAGVPVMILEPAMQESKRILASAGVDLLWVRCPTTPERLTLERSCQDLPRSSTLLLHILPHAATRLQTKPREFGFAVPGERDGVGGYATIFYDCFDQLGMAIGESAAMGHVIAHELGHLLLGEGHHSGAGIMKANWPQKQIELAAQGALAFNRAERRRIQGNIRRRIQADGRNAVIVQR